MNAVGIFTAIAALLVGGVVGHEIGDKPQDMDMNRYRGGRAVEVDTSKPEPIDYVSVRPELSSLPMSDLDEEERAGLLLMREEEKLARDVYTTLYDKWGQRIFINIAQSEQTHTEAVRDLLVRYELEDPVKDDTVGVFTNPDMQVLYDDLVEQGSGSLVEALKVGAMVEDLDIADLQKLSSETDNDDIKLVYSNLERGSRNHLRAFTSQLQRQGTEYEPTHISNEYYEEIISSERETGTGSGGKNGGHGGGQGYGNGGGAGSGSQGQHGGRGWGRQ